jgi:hypothetical protein
VSVIRLDDGVLQLGVQVGRIGKLLFGVVGGLLLQGDLTRCGVSVSRRRPVARTDSQPELGRLCLGIAGETPRCELAAFAYHHFGPLLKKFMTYAQKQARFPSCMKYLHTLTTKVTVNLTH